MKFVIKSAGALHMSEIPHATLVFDVQDLAYDPNLKPELRHLSGDTPEIRQFVLSSPGVMHSIHLLMECMINFSRMSLRPETEEISLLVYCRGGRHRSRVIVDEVANLLGCWADCPVEIEHMHAHLPVVEK